MNPNNYAFIPSQTVIELLFHEKSMFMHVNVAVSVFYFVIVILVN